MTDRGSQSGRFSGGRQLRARSVIAAVLIGASLVSIVVSSAVNYRSAEVLLKDQAESQIIQIGTSRVRSIERGVDRLAQSTISLAEDTALGEAFRDFSEAYAALDQQLTQDQNQQLVDAYDRARSTVAPPGFDVPSLESVLPASDRARYLQFHYVVKNPMPPEDRSGLDDAGDGSLYSEVHRQFNPWLRGRLAYDDDVLLINADGAVVYSAAKRFDLGTDLEVGPLRESLLATEVRGEIAQLPRGQARLIDFDSYLPAGNAPTAFLAAPVRYDGEYLGTLAVPIDGSDLSAFTTAGEDWEGTGLGTTGEFYIVGEDRLMRSDSRLAIEQPETYATAVVDAGYSSEVADAALAFGTTALIQPVETDAVAAGLKGDTFSDVSQNYLGVETFTVAGPITYPGVNWVAVSEISTDEAFQPLNSYIRRVLLLAVVLLPIIAVLGFLLARRLIRPIDPVVDAARRVSQGDLNVALPDQSRDEYGELARRFNEMVAALRDKEDALRRADDETTELLMSALPRRLIEQVKAGDLDIAESVRNGSIVAISIDGLVDDLSGDRDAQRDLGVDLHTFLADLAVRHEIDPVHSSASELLFGAGLESDELEADHAAAFVLAAQEGVAELASSVGADLIFRAGVAAGEFVAGLVGTDRLTFDAWGGPPRLAIGLMTMAAPDQILCDANTMGALDPTYRTERASRLVDLSGEPLDGWVLEGPQLTSTKTE
ncbi:MAG: HAMP domain-containing protein [Acidimicrobiales bacterium]